MGEIAPEEQFLPLSTTFYYLVLDFYVKTGIRFSIRDKRLFEITEVEITRVDCKSLRVIFSSSEEQDSAALQRQCVILIKLYPWLKDEMDKTSAVVIASKVLSRDHTESIFNSSQRRMAVDMLLKIVLKNKYSFLSKFFGVLKDTWNSKDMLEQKLEAVNPTENEVEGSIIFQTLRVKHFLFRRN